MPKAASSEAARTLIVNVVLRFITDCLLQGQIKVWQLLSRTGCARWAGRAGDKRRRWSDRINLQEKTYKCSASGPT
jgi:hypothetical protein